MRDFASWSVSLGRWGGVQVRLHAFFLLFAVLTLYFAVDSGSGGHELVWQGFAALGILLVSVLLHEWGHCLAALHFGGRADEIVLGPLGGLAPVQVPPAPMPERVAALAGPAANLILALVCLPLLVAKGVDVVGLLNPLAPNAILSGAAWLVLVKLTFWINWLLLLVNMLPCFPLDGARVLRSFLWPSFPYPTAVVIVVHVAQVVAVALVAVGVIFRQVLPDSPVPAWAPLSLLAIFLFFSAQQELQRLESDDREGEFADYDFTHGYTSLEAPLRTVRRGPGPWSRWLNRRRQQRKLRQAQVEADEERRVDEILARLQEVGINGLSSDDRRLLERVAARYRERQGK
jgi:Zn-dependent protease